MDGMTTTPDTALDALRETDTARTWVVWSNEHDCWWAGNHSGYTSSLLSAGLYTEAEAKEIARPRRNRGRPDEEARPLAVALADEATKWHGPKVVEHVLALLTEHTALRAERDGAIFRAVEAERAWHEDTASLADEVAALSTRLAVAGEDTARLWAVERWQAEVANRPLVNIHRRTLDVTWRQVIRHFGGDDEALCGPRHDELVDTAARRSPTTRGTNG